VGRRDLVVILAIARPADTLDDSGFDEASRVGADAGATHGEAARDLVEGQLLG
jgi:hypothetical protein